MIEIPNEYKLIRKSIKILKSCIHPQQKLTALNYARLAIEKEIIPKSKKEKDIVECEKEKDVLFKFISNLASDKCNNIDFLDSELTV